MNKNKVIIIYGPTGVGKTEYALNLGKNQKIEIINGDVGQFYEPLAIGTAKPDWKNEEIPHHLFDVLSKPVDCTVAQYRTMVLEKVKEVWNRGNLPVIVGGSGFYIKSLFFIPEGPHCDQKEVEQDSSVSTQDLWERLKQRDPERADALYQQDRYRIERALALLSKGIQASKCAPVYQELDADVLIVFLNRDRSELYERINERTQSMLDAGWLKEVELLLGAEWESFLIRKKLIGYNDIIVYLQGDRTDQEKEQLINIIQKKTRNYAKRQLTFWRMLEKLINQKLHKPSHALEISLSQDDAKKIFDGVVQDFIKG
jgi:tRNA dimethylallyltransferase